eukprot:m.30932 g.30932  ORF g.30932 m.30932 type:complete len:833 (+) comp6263_c0_seq1:41-2539(+)
MSCAGFDIGYQSSSFAVPKAGGIEVLLNDYSKRSTPTIVSFGDKQRFLGESGKQKMATQFKNTITYFKTIIGRKFNAPDVQKQLALAPFKFFEMEDGTVGVDVVHCGEQMQLSVTQVMGMLISHLKECTETALGNAVSDSVVGIPSYFNDTQRHALLDACKIANINCLRVMNETAAVALAYGIYKTDLNDTPKRVVFFDFGHSAVQMSLCSLVKGRLKIEFTKHVMVGGRDFDLMILDKMASEFKESTKLDLKTSPRVMIRMEAECEKMKKYMSSNSTDIPMNIECLMDDRDFRSKMNREEFEALCKPLFDKINALIEEFVDELKSRDIALDSLDSVEIVGGSSRVPLVQTMLFNAFGKTPSKTLNADEAVARGCALMSAMLSPTFMVREFKVEDATPYGINLCWTPHSDDGENAQESESQIYKANDNSSVAKVLSFFRKADFDFSAKYAVPEVIPDQQQVVGEYQIKGCTPAFDGKAQKVKVEISIDSHGCFNVTKATLIEKVPEEEEETPAKKEAEGEGEKKEAKDEEEKEKSKEEGDKKKEDDEKKEGGEDQSPKKKKAKVHKKRLHVVSNKKCVLSEKKLTDLIEIEANLALGDRREREKNDARNALEEYIYEMRDKIASVYEEFTKPAENDEFRQRLTKMEDWLYEDGENESKQVYNDQLKDLKLTGDDIVSRKNEWEARPKAIESLQQAIVHYRKFLNECAAGDEKYTHLSEEDVAKVEGHVDKKEKFLASKLAEQQPLAKSDKPAFKSSELTSAEKELTSLCNPIVNKPKPKEEPPKEETSEEDKEAGEEKKEEGKDAEAEKNADGEAEKKEEGSESMDTDADGQ